jgi:hypothetical protein
MHHAQRSNLVFIKRVTARGRLSMDDRKIRAYGATRKRVRSKSVQLRMGPIASCLPAKHRSSQQRFAPQRDQTLRIKVLRVN